ncbi:MAG: DNA primase, partial [Desulfurococcaceae archaeon]|nr:DNA primase [Desulfurococcaceae archaeon]
MLGGADLRFARDILTRYYRVANLRLPKDLALREFAFQTLDQGVYVRHLSFTSEAELRGYLVLNTPRQAYYSTAKYSNPAAQSYEDSGW